MNELKITINFKTQKFIIDGIDLISGDYNSTKLKFNFEEDIEGTKTVEIRPFSSEDKNPTFMSTITNNEVILVAQDSEEHSISPFSAGGTYLMEVSVYGENSKLSTITKHFNVLDKEIILTDEVIEPYLPIFDELMQEIISATNEAENVNIAIQKVDNITTVTITNRDGVSKSVEIKDGVDGIGIASILKIATVGLTDTYRITLTDNSYVDYQVTNGRGIVSINKTDTSDNVDTYTITYNDGTSSTFTVTNGTLTRTELLEELTNITNILPKVSGEDSSVFLNNTGNSRLINIKIDGKSYQSGTPTPTNPVNIVSVGSSNIISNKYSIEVISRGKNLINKVETHNGVNSSGVLNSYDTYLGIDGYVEVEPNTTYSVSFEHDVLTATLMLAEKAANGDFIERRTIGKSIRTFTTGANTKYIIFYVYKSSDFETVGGWVQLERGSEATTYEPYVSSSKIYLLDEPLRSIGDIKDKAYIENGILKVKRYIGTLTLDGTISFTKQDTWSAVGNTTNAFYKGYTNFTNMKANSQVVSDHFEWVQNLQNYDEYGIYLTTNLIIRVPKTITSTQELNTWFSNNNTILQYILNTPTDETVGEVNLPNTYYSATNITTGDPLSPNISATALKDISNL